MKRNKKVQLATLVAFLLSSLALGFAQTQAGTAAAGDSSALQKPANPCNPCAKKPQNPCNPCAKKAQNPCNPCAGKQASSEVYQPATAFGGWKKINKKPLRSEAHGGLFVTTYANSAAENAIKAKAAAFPAGSILVKESFMDNNGKPGPKGMIFAMEKQADGWMWITTDATGHMTGKGDSTQMAMCAQCHASAKMDSAFLRSK